MMNCSDNISKTYSSTIEEDPETGDYIVIIPEEILQYNNWKEGQALMVEVIDDKIHIRALPNDNDN